MIKLFKNVARFHSNVLNEQKHLTLAKNKKTKLQIQNNISYHTVDTVVFIYNNI